MAYTDPSVPHIHRIDGGDYSRILDLMIETAYEAGRLAMNMRHSTDLEIYKKQDGSVVTGADIALEEFYKERLWSVIGGEFLGEETVARQHSATPLKANFNPEHLWSVDPIDGTANYVGGKLPGGYPSISETCTSVAYCDAQSGEPILGIVYNFVSDVMFVAREGKGAWVLDRGGRHDLRVTDTCHPAASNDIHHSSASSAKSVELQELVQKFAANCNDRARTRVNGCSALELVHVATGAARAFTGALMPWDYNAAQLIAQEAGANVEVLKGAAGKKDVIVAASEPELQKALVGALDDGTARRRENWLAAVTSQSQGASHAKS